MRRMQRNSFHYGVIGGAVPMAPLMGERSPCLQCHCAVRLSVTHAVKLVQRQMERVICQVVVMVVQLLVTCACLITTHTSLPLHQMVLYLTR